MTHKRFLFEGWRPVCKRRARQLSRRGEFVYYNIHHETWCWNARESAKRQEG